MNKVIDKVNLTIKKDAKELFGFEKNRSERVRSWISVARYESLYGRGVIPLNSSWYSNGKFIANDHTPVVEEKTGNNAWYNIK